MPDFPTRLARKWCRQFEGPNHGPLRTLDECGVCYILTAAVKEALEEAEKKALEFDAPNGSRSGRQAARAIATRLAVLRGIV